MYVYLIRSMSAAECFYKIGKATSPFDRFRNFQCASPFEMELIATVRCKSDQHAYAVEHHVHGRLKEFKQRGEWFTSSVGWNETVRLICDAIDILVPEDLEIKDLSIPAGQKVETSLPLVSPGPPRAPEPADEAPFEMNTYTLEEAAAIAKMHKHTLRKKSAAGEVPATKIGRRWIFPCHLFDTWIENKCLSTVAQAPQTGGARFPSLAMRLANRRKQATESKPRSSSSASGTVSGGSIS